MILLSTVLVTFAVLAEPNPCCQEEGLSAKDQEKIAQFLKSYDQAWISGKAEAFHNLFSNNAYCSRKVCKEYEGFLDSHKPLRCQSSTIQTRKAEKNIGVYAETSMRYALREAPEGERDFQRQTRSARLFLLTMEEDSFKIIRVEEFDAQFAPELNAVKIACPACNFEISRPKNWFLLPRSRGWAACTETISFLHPSGEVIADLEIIEALQDVDPKAILEADHSYMMQSCSLSKESAETPQGKAIELGKNHQGYETEGSFVQTCPEGNKLKTRYLRRYLSQGPVLYCLNVYGNAPAFQSYRSEIDTLKASLQIIDPAKNLSSLRETMKSRHNPGSSLEQNNYLNKQYNVRLQGPAGWRGENFSGPALFHVRFFAQKNNEVQLNFHAIEDPNGWPNVNAVEQMIAERESRINCDGRTGIKRLESRAFPHKGIQTFCYEVDWLRQGTKSVRERVAYFPAGTILYILEFRSPAELFEENLPAYQAAIDSLSRF